MTWKASLPYRGNAERANGVLVQHSCIGSSRLLLTAASSTPCFHALSRLFWTHTCCTPQHSGPKLSILIPAIAMTAILSDLIQDTNVETANGAINLHSISIRFIVVLRLVRSYRAGILASGEVLASVGTQSRSIERILAPRESFSAIPRTRATAKKPCFGAGLVEDKMTTHVIQDVRTLMRLTTIVTRSTWRRDGVQSTQRPRALPNKRTQTVSAMPLQSEVRLDAYNETMLEKSDAHLIEEAVRLPANDA